MVLSGSGLVDLKEATSLLGSERLRLMVPLSSSSPSVLVDALLVEPWVAQERGGSARVGVCVCVSVLCV